MNGKRAFERSIHAAQAANSNQAAVNINLDDMTMFCCPDCAVGKFEPVFEIYEIPELLRPMVQGKNMVNVQLWRCANCGWAGPMDQLAKVTADERKVKMPGVKVFLEIATT